VATVSQSPLAHPPVSRPQVQFASVGRLVAPFGLDLYSVEEIMSITVEALEAEALNLSIAERARLVEKLIVSLDAEPDIEAAWAAEVERRHAEIESGAASLLPGPETLDRLKAEFR
jgi:putative addiction module component (TIGR02574 family)